MMRSHVHVYCAVLQYVHCKKETWWSWIMSNSLDYQGISGHVLAQQTWDYFTTGAVVQQSKRYSKAFYSYPSWASPGPSMAPNWWVLNFKTLWTRKGILGSPSYPSAQDADGPTAMQLDAYVDVERLAEAMSELDKYIEAARAQLFEIRKKKDRTCICVDAHICTLPNLPCFTTFCGNTLHTAPCLIWGHQECQVHAPWKHWVRTCGNRSEPHF